MCRHARRALAQLVKKRKKGKNTPCNGATTLALGVSTNKYMVSVPRSKIRCNTTVKPDGTIVCYNEIIGPKKLYFYCPICRRTTRMRRYGMAPRGVLDARRNCTRNMVQRLQCTECGHVHNVLANNAVPNKWYAANVIEKVLTLSDLELDFRGYSCSQRTRGRWRSEMEAHRAEIETRLRQVRSIVVHSATTVAARTDDPGLRTKLLQLRANPLQGVTLPLYDSQYGYSHQNPGWIAKVAHYMINKQLI